VSGIITGLVAAVTASHVGLPSLRDCALDEVKFALPESELPLRPRCPDGEGCHHIEI